MWAPPHRNNSHLSSSHIATLSPTSFKSISIELPVRSVVNSEKNPVTNHHFYRLESDGDGEMHVRVVESCGELWRVVESCGKSEK